MCFVSEVLGVPSESAGGVQVSYRTSPRGLPPRCELHVTTMRVLARGRCGIEAGGSGNRAAFQAKNAPVCIQCGKPILAGSMYSLPRGKMHAACKT